MAGITLASVGYRHQVDDSAPINQRVTVVVLTHNRRAEALGAVARCLALPGSPRVIVVDNASDDGTPAVLRSRHPGLSVVELPENVGGAGRNAGLRDARTPYVAFCDDDAWWEPAALTRAVSLLDAEPRLAVVTGLVLVGDQARVDDICVEMASTPLGSGNDRSGYPVLGFMAGASVVRRAAMLEVGGFAERFLVGGEEELVALDLAARGWQLRYVPAVVVHHHPSRIRRPEERRRLILRNSLWTALLRYPPGMLVRRARKVVAEARRHRLAWPIALETFGELAWLIRGRRRLPVAVVKQVALLRAHQVDLEV